MATAPFRMEFERKYRIKDGKAVEYDVVQIYHPGMSQRAKTPLLVSEVMRVREDGDADNPAWLAAKIRRDAIVPAWEAWKRGEDLPDHGTPLGAWPGITLEQGTALKAAGIRTVEEIATANDALISKIPLPNVRVLKALAEAFLAGSDKAKVASELADKDRQLAEMREQIEELRQIALQNLREDDDEGTEAPRRRGRPPKVQDEVAA